MSQEARDHMMAVLAMTEPLHRDELPLLFDHMGFRIGAEVGVYKGQFSEIILDASQLTKLYSVDARISRLTYHLGHEETS